jgi:hypothetical protein
MIKSQNLTILRFLCRFLQKKLEIFPILQFFLILIKRTGKIGKSIKAAEYFAADCN